MAFLTLFRVATGDNWNGIMKVSNSMSSMCVHGRRRLFLDISIFRHICRGADSLADVESLAFTCASAA